MKTPEDFAREAAERLVRVTGYHESDPNPQSWYVEIGVDDGADWMSMILNRQQAETNAGHLKDLLTKVYAAAIRAYAAQSPVHGSPLSDERLAEIQNVYQSYFYEDVRPANEGSVVAALGDALAHIDFLSAIMCDDIDSRARDEAYRKGQMEGAKRQREACVRQKDEGFDVETTPLVIPLRTDKEQK